MNFLDDWHNEMIEEINQAGLRFSDNLAKDYLIIRYFTYLRKLGSKKSLNIHKSREFVCPDEYQDGLQDIEEKLKQGEDISPYLSKDADKLVNDLMFNDWGVIHLHLGKELEENGQYIKRTGPLLFLYFKEDNAYLINIFPHQNWTKKEVLQIMYSNWPELIKPYIMTGVQGLEPGYSESQHLKLRKKGYNVMLELEDENGEKFAMIPPGMGIASSGDPVQDVKKYHQIIKQIRDIEEMIKSQSSIDVMEQAMNEQNVMIPSIFKLRFVNGKVKEENTNLLFDLI